jgi:hypothetical protein
MRIIYPKVGDVLVYRIENFLFKGTYQFGGFLDRFDINLFGISILYSCRNLIRICGDIPNRNSTSQGKAIRVTVNYKEENFSDFYLDFV